ncbi:quinone-dependent dihydroorotate dehydrogenase [Campylobacter sp. RM16192]|uniref:quinone-dependent dihydroorotate dehydrogenase n=1 Tax=Campylobacter sp. RM16192 TaxID=1660080 RepID=UPI001451B861|nr:quinone-dependent dihydroorotate dehydrogenase [Campylobacter sp. RM16192]QCD52591.1 dihydroorotate dehydrogenase 2 [Campylobacter sp. RM16192]
MNYNDLKTIFFKFQPETAHTIAECAMVYADKIFPGSMSFVANKCVINDARLQQNLLNLVFNNPIGIAGGFDKNATMLKPLTALGFGHIEFGTVTPKPQSGNEKPRLFRLVEEESIQNAMGFNNEGAKKIAKRVQNLYPFVIPLFANIGKNKVTPNENALEDYENLTKEFSDICDAFVVNISSPNTPNLRNLQDASFVKELFDRLTSITKKPIIFKIAPDMDDEKAVEICKTAVESGASGVIVNNTSIDYSLSKSPNLQNFGGLSGKVIAEKSRRLFKAVADELFGKTVLIASGGIDSGEEAYRRIRMGANLVQIYTAFIFRGPAVCRYINLELLELLERDGFANISEAVGMDVGK